jgi:pilus assembly protein CpaE
MAQLTCLIYAELESDGKELAQRLEETGHVEVVERLGDRQQLGHRLRTAEVDAAFVVLGSHADATLDVVERSARGRAALILAGPADRSELILRAMRLGAREYMPPRPDRDTLTALLDRLMLEPSQRGRTNRSPLIGVVGAKGGVGATVTASQLAAALQCSGRVTCLVDLHLRQGDVALHYDLNPAYTLADIAKCSGGFDESYLQSIVETHASGVSILAAPTRAEDAELVQPAHVERSLTLLQAHYDCVVIDLPPLWDDVGLRALDLVNELLLVLALDLPTLSHARQHLELLERLGLPSERIRLVANRYGKTNPVADRDADRFLGRALDFRIPNDYHTAMESLTSGNPLTGSAPRSALRQSFQALADRTLEWCGVVAPAEPVEKSSLSRVRNFIRRGRHGSD